MDKAEQELEAESKLGGKRRGPGRPKGGKNKPKFYDVKVTDSLAMAQIKARAEIDATGAMKRMGELANDLANLHRNGAYLRRDEVSSIAVELRILQALTAKVLPDLALVKVEQPRDDERLMHGVVVLPELESPSAQTKGQRSDGPSQAQDAGTGTGADGIGAKSNWVGTSRGKKARA